MRQARVQFGADGTPQLSELARGATCVVEKLYETEGARPVSLTGGKLVVPVAGGEELSFAAVVERDARDAAATKGSATKKRTKEAACGAVQAAKRARAVAAETAQT